MASAMLPAAVYAMPDDPQPESVEDMHADFIRAIGAVDVDYSVEEQPTGYVPYEYVNTVTGDAPYRRTSRGIFVVGPAIRCGHLTLLAALPPRRAPMQLRLINIMRLSPM